MTCATCGYEFPKWETLATRCPECGVSLNEDGSAKLIKNEEGEGRGVSNQISAVMKRYKDAYLVARAVNGYGASIKALGVIAAILLVLVGVVIASQSGPAGATWTLGAISIISGVIAGTWFYIIGVLVSAQGQILKASLDGAVNNSPFLTNDYRAKIMSLPEQ